MAAAQLTSGSPPRKLLAVLGEPPRHVDSRSNEDNRSLFTDELRRLIATSGDGRAIRVGLGAMALAAASGTEKESRRVVSSYLTAPVR